MRATNKKQWNDIFKVLKEKDFQPKILYSAKLSYTNERDIKICYIYLPSNGKAKRQSGVENSKCKLPESPTNWIFSSCYQKAIRIEPLSLRSRMWWPDSKWGWERKHKMRYQNICEHILGDTVFQIVAIMNKLLKAKCH